MLILYYSILTVNVTYNIQNLKVYLESFPYKFCETCETPQHLTEEQIVLRLPEATNVNMGYKIVADKTPCIVSVGIYY